MKKIRKINEDKKSKKEKPSTTEALACIKCGKPASYTWPNLDPDIRSYPYCRECLEKVKNTLLMMLFNGRMGKSKH